MTYFIVLEKKNFSKQFMLLRTHNCLETEIILFTFLFKLHFFDEIFIHSFMLNKPGKEFNCKVFIH